MTKTTNTYKGMACMVVGVLMLASADAVTKLLIVDFHAGEIIFYRGVFAFIPLVPLIVWNGGLRSLRLQQPRGVWWRGVIALLTSVFVALSFINLPLAEASALIFTSPIFLTALSPWLLGEKVGWQRWSAVLFGFAGVVVMIEPGSSTFTLWAFVPLIAALCSASRDIVTRRLGIVDSATTVMFYTSIVALIGGAISMPWSGPAPNAEQWALFVLSGIFVSLAHLLIVMALQLAEGPTVAPLKYVSLVWSAILGYLIWGDVPGTWKVLGAMMVVAAGLFIIYRETQSQKVQRALVGD
ncbi:MAG: hypothetical protein CMF67_00190 [Magnetovibrio sp.]|nr:hypothetical protein [Magnetovibrio sp.]